MKMHGLHGFDELDYFKGKSNNEIIILLEEIFRADMLRKKIHAIKQQLGDNANTAIPAQEGVI
jgi:hypothetical protein